MSGEPPDVTPDADAVLKQADGAPAQAAPAEADAARPARTVPRPAGPASVRKPPVPAGPKPAAFEATMDDAAPTERRPKVATPLDDEVPGVEGFLAAFADPPAPPPAPAAAGPGHRPGLRADEPPSAPGPGSETGAESGGHKRRSRRTVKTPEDAAHSKPSPSAAPPPAAAPAPAAAEPTRDSPTPATVPVAPAATPAPTENGASAAKPAATPAEDAAAAEPPAAAKPVAPRPVPRPRTPAAPPPAAPPAAAEESPPTMPTPGVAPPAAAREEASAAAAPAPAAEDEPIRPMRIISIGEPPPEPPAPPPPPAPAAAAPAPPPPPPAPPPPPPPRAMAETADDEAGWVDAEPAHPSRPPLHAAVELEPFAAPPPPPVPVIAPPPSSQAVPQKPPAVEEVEAIADEEEHDEPAKADEVVSLPDEEIVPDRISEVDPISGHDDITVDVEEPAPRPKKPPPPPKRPTSIEPPAAAAAAAPVVPATPAAPVIVSAPPAATGGAPAAPPPPPPVSVRKEETPPAPPAAPPAAASGPPSAQTLDLGKKRAKPWWEEVFSDDYIRTMERVEPRIIRKECDFIEDRLGLEKGAVMLDVCCGSGAHAVELASRGYNVVGYDLSLAMLARAQDEALERGQRINFLQGDVREMAFDEAFDGMYSWSTSFGYFEDDKNLNVLQRIHRGLRKGGIFLLDVINRDYVCPRQPSLVWFEGDGCVCMDEMHVDFFTSRLKVKRTVMFEDGRSRECDYAIRLYALHELGKMLHETGFKVLEVTGHPAHPGVFFGSESPRIIVLAERG